jgi:hypothetical protein
MGKSTIKFYEKSKTETLKKLLSSYETAKFNMGFINKSVSDNLEEKISDYEIDISLIRMELNKRLWSDSVIKN